MLGVGSWDHLTTKGLIHEVPDRVLVWNEAQKQEAIALHGVPAERVLVTGAQAYDHWFADAALARSRRRSAARSSSIRRGRSCSISARRRSSRRTRWDSCAGGSPRSARAAIRGCGRRACSCGRIRRTAEAVGGRGSGCRIRRRGVLAEDRREPDRRPGAQRLLRLDLPLRSRRRREHERHDRVGHRRAAGLHD